MAFEQKWPAVSPRLFTTNGDANGNIMVADTRGFKVKQAVTIRATGQPNLFVQVKRVIGRRRIIVGPIQAVAGKESLQTRSDLTGYTVAAGAFIFAEEQVKAKLKPDDIRQAVYEQEPTVAERVIGVDQQGEFYDEDNPLPIQNVNTLIRDRYDELDVVQKNACGDPLLINVKYEGVTIATLTIQYDLEFDLKNVKYTRV